MPHRKIRAAASEASEKAPAQTKMRRRLSRAARAALLAASLTAAQLSAEADFFTENGKLFAPDLLDRLQAPITRFPD